MVFFTSALVFSSTIYRIQIINQRLVYLSEGYNVDYDNSVWRVQKWYQVNWACIYIDSGIQVRFLYCIYIWLSDGKFVFSYILNLKLFYLNFTRLAQRFFSYEIVKHVVFFFRYLPLSFYELDILKYQDHVAQNLYILWIILWLKETRKSFYD